MLFGDAFNAVAETAALETVVTWIHMQADILAASEDTHLESFGRGGF